jgi:hypothetical protein
MIKDKTILDLIDKLRSKTHFDRVEIVDYWDGDLCAIGIKRDNRLVYICSYDFREGKVNGYDYDLELLDEKQVDKLNVVKEARNVTEEILIEELKVFLEI